MGSASEGRSQNQAYSAERDWGQAEYGQSQWSINGIMEKKEGEADMMDPKATQCSSHIGENPRCLHKPCVRNAHQRSRAG